MYISSVGGDLILSDIEDLDISRTFDCGQCFRFEVSSLPGGGHAVKGVALGRLLETEQPEPDRLIIKRCDEKLFDTVWKHYLALDTDYAAVNRSFVSGSDPVMSRAAARSRGIRILRQDPWEALCSFIISQNNNIPRIKGIIDRLCRTFGDPFETCGETYYSFPSAERLAGLSVEEIFALRVGFRASYISDAAKKVASGEIDLEKVRDMSTPEALAALCKIKGVGPKVASCALLFGFDKGDCFPIDVWVRRVLAKYYPEGLDPAVFGEFAGLAQQYLFYYERYMISKESAV